MALEAWKNCRGCGRQLSKTEDVWTNASWAFDVCQFRCDACQKRGTDYAVPTKLTSEAPDVVEDGKNGMLTSRGQELRKKRKELEDSKRRSREIRKYHEVD